MPEKYCASVMSRAGGNAPPVTEVCHSSLRTFSGRRALHFWQTPSPSLFIMVQKSSGMGEKVTMCRGMLLLECRKIDTTDYIKRVPFFNDLGGCVCVSVP